MFAEAEIGRRRLRSICVLGSTSSGRDPTLMAAARRLGQEIALGAIRLVYGGGSSGIVGAVAKGAASCNGSVVAIPHKSEVGQGYHSVGSEQVVAVADMHVRKRLMFDYADAFVALPGGVDTIDAMAEVLALRQSKQHRKPLVLANITGLWTPWLKLLDHIEASGFCPDGNSLGFVVADDVSQVLPLLRRAIEEPEDSGWSSFAEAIEDAGGFYSPPNP